MRGKSQAQPDFLTVVNLNACVPGDHPLRAIKRRVDTVLQKLSPLFDQLYAEQGRASIPPEQLLKARVLTALYSVRSERLFCEQLGYNLLWLWFLDREFSEGSFDHSIFAKNYERVLSADVAKLFFAEVYDLSRQEGWTSDEHFTADGTLIESWASLKSFVRKDGSHQKKVDSAKDDDPGNPTISFHGEKRCNQTHRSTTDPDSVLYRKAKGKEARDRYKQMAKHTMEQATAAAKRLQMSADNVADSYARSIRLAAAVPAVQKPDKKQSGKTKPAKKKKS